MGMSYKIIYTEESEQDLVNVYRYIAMNLLMPETAKKQIDRIMNAIKGLDELPLRHKLYQDEPWHSEGMRVFPVDSYFVFYIVIEEEKTVAIVRIMYGGRNIELQLSNTKIVD
jgi:toxin ParE1/3/4